MPSFTTSLIILAVHFTTAMYDGHDGQYSGETIGKKFNSGLEWDGQYIRSLRNIYQQGNNQLYIIINQFWWLFIFNNIIAIR